MDARDIKAVYPSLERKVNKPFRPIGTVRVLKGLSWQPGEEYLKV